MLTSIRLAVATLCLSGAALAGPTPSPIAAYASVIAQAQAELEAGRAPLARQQLAATNPAQRGFEYDYLLARSQDDVGTSDLVRVVPKPAVDVLCGVLHPVERQVVLLCRDGNLRICDLRAPEAAPKAVVNGKGSPVCSGAFSGDGKIFVAGGENGEAVVWDTVEWKTTRTTSLGERPVRQLAVAPDGSAFVAEGSSDLELWSLADPSPRKLAAVGRRFRFGEGLAFSPSGNLLATGGMFDVQLRDAGAGALAKSIRHASYTMSLAFSPDGKRIASATRGDMARVMAVFDAGSGAQLWHAGPFPEYIAGLAFSPDGRRIAAAGCEKAVRLCDAATGETVLLLKRPACGMAPAFSANGRFLGWSEPDGYCFIDLAASFRGSLRE